jgi:hypothetical protein
MKVLSINSFYRIIFSVLTLGVPVLLSGQGSNLLKLNSLNDKGNNESSSEISHQAIIIKELYSERIEVPEELINGKEYEPYYLRSDVKPLLFPSIQGTASIFTKTRVYKNLSLQYDTFLDEVIYTDTSKTINSRFPQIALNKDIIDGFNLYFKDDSLKFRYFRLPECQEKNLKEGFYERVYNEKSEYVIKHESSFYVHEGLNNYKYSPKNLIRTGKHFYKVKNRKSLLALFGNKSGEVKKFIHDSGIRVRKADKTQILMVLKFYDSLQ